MQEKQGNRERERGGVRGRREREREKGGGGSGCGSGKKESLQGITEGQERAAERGEGENDTD